MYAQEWDGWTIYGNSIFRFWRNLNTCLHSGCMNLHSYPQRRRVPFSAHPLQHLLFIDILIITILTSVVWYFIVVFQVLLKYSLFTMLLLVSGVQQSDSVISMLILFQILVSCRLSQNIKQTEFSVLKEVLVVVLYSLYMLIQSSWFILPCLPHFPSGNHKFVFDICKSVSVM